MSLSAGSWASLARWPPGKGTLTWILGIDMAHMGARYGDDWRRGEPAKCRKSAQRDHLRIESVLASDARAFGNR